MVLIGLAALAATGGGAAMQARGAMPAQHEMAMARQWAGARFGGVVHDLSDAPGIRVAANYGAVQANARAGRPLNVGGHRSSSGFYCHAPSRLVVRLERPGKRFRARVGVDSNDQTSGGRGSVVFSVRAGGRTLWKSARHTEGMAAEAVDVDLQGAATFELCADDAGDGISCDQADWADAVAETASGPVRLGDLPLFASRGPIVTDAPFSFRYAGRESAALLAAWPCERATTMRAGAAVTTVMWREPGGGLVVTCESTVSAAFPTVEWTVRFRNEGGGELPILTDVRAMDLRWERSAGDSFVLHHNRGDRCTADSFEPFTTPITGETDLKFAPDGGRPSSGAWPYFHLAGGDGGTLIAVGWPGQWSARFVGEGERSVRAIAGQQTTRFTLRPGEEVRAPLIALLFASGDRARGQNLWRQWMLTENHPQGLKPSLVACSGWHFPGLKCNQAGEIAFIDAFRKSGVKLDYWWMDAGWYRCGDAGWPQVGTWEVDRARYPGGVRAVSDHAHAGGEGTVLWFEPERVSNGTELAEKHAGWLLGKPGGERLLDLGNPEARTWITERVDSLIRSEGIDLYRQDFNIDPLGFWQQTDTPGREGMTENHYVTGFLAFWDELRRRHPGMIIDSCASGGRRNDLETMRRSVPLLRSDYEFEPDGLQRHTYGFDAWLPYHEIGSRDLDAYSIRSDYAPMLGLVWDPRRPDVDWPRARRMLAEWRSVAPIMLGDMHALTAYDATDAGWQAMQYHRVDLDTSVLLVFRRGRSPYETARFPLRGLTPRGRYRVTDQDTGRAVTRTGAYLMGEGLRVAISERPGSALWRIEAVGPAAKDAKP